MTRQDMNQSIKRDKTTIDRMSVIFLTDKKCMMRKQMCVFGMFISRNENIPLT